MLLYAAITIMLLHAARYCNAAEATVDAGTETGVVTPKSCPQGYYCMLNTETKHEYACSAGTYGNNTELEIQSECTPCDGGWYCPNEGKYILVIGSPQ